MGLMGFAGELMLLTVPRVCGLKSGLLHSCIFSGFKAVKIWLFCTAVMSKILLDSGQLFTLSNLLAFKTPVQGKQSIVPQTQKHL